MSNYGYCFNLEKEDRNELESLLGFSVKNLIDFYFNVLNMEHIEKVLIERDFKKTSEQEFEKEKEIIYTKGNKEIFFYF